MGEVSRVSADSADSADSAGSGRGLDLRFMTDGLGETEMAVLYDPDAPESAWIRAPRKVFLEGVERYR
jgi:hypothetical protein